MSAILGFDVAAHLLAFNESLGRATTIEETRRAFETYPIDPSPVVGTIVHEIAEPAGSWFGRPNDNPARRGLYLHGGGYVAGSITTYTGVVSRLAVATRSWIFIPNVPLAPESRFPAAHESNMLTAIVGLSPLLDMTASGESYSRCARSDTVVSRELTRHCVATYAPETDPCDPRLSPLFGTFSMLPPVLLQVSEDEAVFDDSTRAALLARQQGCQLEVQTWRGLPHVWHLLAPRLPEAEIAIGRVGRFIERAIGDAA